MSERKRVPGWVWGVGLGVVAGVLLLAFVLTRAPPAPPPAMPLRQPPVAKSPPPVARPPEPPSAPPAPPPSTSVLADAPTGESTRRREAFESVDQGAEEQSRQPKLRRGQQGIAPKHLERKYTGRSAGKGVANVLFITTYQGKDVSAPVVVDGVWRGNSPLSLTLRAGTHLIRIDHGRTRVNEFLTDFTGGRSVRLEVELRPASEWRGNKLGKKHRH